MFFEKNLRNIIILAVLSTLLFTHCKQQSTTPDVSDLTRPVIWLNQFNISFAAYEAGANPSSKVLQIKNSGQQTLEYTLSTDTEWVSFSPESGTSTGQIVEHAISIDKNGLQAQNDPYTATITITSSQAYNNPQSVTVSLNVSEEPPPEIWTSTQQLTFNAQEGGSNPSSQALKIKNTGSGTLQYQITDSANWLDVNPKSGSVQTGERNHTVSVNIAGLQEGTYDGTITITDPDASNSPQQVDVTLNISEQPPVVPPSTKTEVGIFINPREGGTGTTVTITVRVDGNTSPIASAFGLNLNYNTTIFQYLGTSKGTLTSSWAAVDGGASSGTVTVGGFRGSGAVIPISSVGSIAVVRFRVITASATDINTQITLTNLIDDIAGMIRNPAVQAFTYRH